MVKPLELVHVKSEVGRQNLSKGDLWEQCTP